ncbi:MAG: hypothetical protein ACJA1A_002238 [Saprospiraceae bacterium]|jgi:uncharacterized protein (DUF1800 family)
MTRLISKCCCYAILLFASVTSICQPDTIVIGFGGYDGVSITASGNSDDSNPENTINQDGYLPNLNAAARFLSQASLGYSYSDTEAVTLMGIEDWITDQMENKPMPFTLKEKVTEYRQFVRDSLDNQEVSSSSRMWDYAWWQYHMTSDDALRQKTAHALSEIIVVSEKSIFGNYGLALSDYYDILLTNAFGNFRDILQDVTYHASMGVYLTYLNNPKTDTIINQYPDENYARELMQLFTIGLYELNNDGTRVLDNEGDPIPTYDNDDILEFSKIFTGLTWADRDQWGREAYRDTSYLAEMVMWNDYHEPGVKNLLNGFQVPDRDPVDGDADISDALDNLFDHPNVGPFISTLLIQRMVTSNPSAAYIDRVATAFNDNGQGIRGDMKAVVRAILLDPVAKACASGDDPQFGKLREPFLRYIQINRAFSASTTSGDFRNDMDHIYDFVEQKPLASPSVFNFYQMDYQPLGPVNDADLFAPEFQITNSQTISGWIDGLYRFVVEENLADEYDLYSGEPNENYDDEITTIDLTTEMTMTNDDELHILIDRLNLLLAQGRLTQPTIEKIITALTNFENEDEDDMELRVKLAIYLVMSSPEYLINR